MPTHKLFHGAVCHAKSPWQPLRRWNNAFLLTRYQIPYYNAPKHFSVFKADCFSYVCQISCEIVNKYAMPQSDYLLPIIKPSCSLEERKQYIYTSHNINRRLKIIGHKLGLSLPLTMYVSRHAWASIAKSKNVPVSVIGEALGHESEATTRIYLASLGTPAIDKANNLILKSLERDYR